VLDGSCRTPIAGYARLNGSDLQMRGLVLRPDGAESLDVETGGVSSDAARLGREAGLDLRARLPAGFLEG
jgi:hydroxymethylbilane synthase